MWCNKICLATVAVLLLGGVFWGIRHAITEPPGVGPAVAGIVPPTGEGQTVIDSVRAKDGIIDQLLDMIRKQDQAGLLLALDAPFQLTRRETTPKDVQALATALRQGNLVAGEYRVLRQALAERPEFLDNLYEPTVTAGLRLVQTASVLHRLELNLQIRRALATLAVRRLDPKLGSGPCQEDRLRAGALAAMLAQRQDLAQALQRALPSGSNPMWALHRQASRDLLGGKPVTQLTPLADAYVEELTQLALAPPPPGGWNRSSSWEIQCGGKQDRQVTAHHPWRYALLQSQILGQLDSQLVRRSSTAKASFADVQLAWFLHHQSPASSSKEIGWKAHWRHAVRHAAGQGARAVHRVGGNLDDVYAEAAGRAVTDPSSWPVDSFVDSVLGVDSYLATELPEWVFRMMRDGFRRPEATSPDALFDLVHAPSPDQAEDLLLYLNFIEFSAAKGHYDRALRHLKGLDVEGVDDLIGLLVELEDLRLFLDKANADYTESPWFDLVNLRTNLAFSRDVCQPW
jgi:hypothetical protein